MPRALWWSYWGGAVSYTRGTHVWHKQDSRAQVLALAFGSQILRPSSCSLLVRERSCTGQVRAHPLAGHADAEARRSVLTALQCATLVTFWAEDIKTFGLFPLRSREVKEEPHRISPRNRIASLRACIQGP